MIVGVSKPMMDSEVRPSWLDLMAVCALVLLLLLGGCGSAPPKPDFADAPVPGLQARATLTLDQANDVTLYAISLVGTPYRFGGNTPQSGFDCSGLINHVYQSRAGISSPRTVSKLKDWGQAIAPEALRSGDLVVFSQKSAADHAGIYVGQGRFVHAPSSGGRVRLDHLNARYWAIQPKVFRRP